MATNHKTIPSDVSTPRRGFLVGLGMAGVAGYWWTRGAFADELTRTPPQTEGPFYPNKLPLDTDNDLIVLNDSLTPAVGDITHLTGRVLDSHGDPIRGAVVEIWQCDHNGAYIHSGSGNADKRDSNFQGFGRFLTAMTGEYYFRTIKPVAYPGRAPHIHFKIKRDGKELLTTQCYIKGESANERDGIYRAIRDAKARDAVSVAFDPIRSSRVAELSARFDIVIGMTPQG